MCAGTAQVGLGYVVQTAERFFAVSAVLNNMVLALPEQPSVRLLKHIIRCYLRLSDNSRAREALRQCLPKLLTDHTFTSCLAEDAQTRGCALLAAVASCAFPLNCAICVWRFSSSVALL